MDADAYWGIYYDGKYYLVYQAAGGDPSDLGIIVEDMIRTAIKNGNIKNWKQLAVDNLRHVHPNEVASDEDIALIDPESRGGVISYDELLFKKYHNFDELLNLGVIPHYTKDGRALPNSQYAYVVNLDDDSFNFYHYSKFQGSYPFAKLPNFQST